ncbi:MAG: hypothetical protein AB7O28_00585 [Vicinamibacterales bacterium]
MNIDTRLSWITVRGSALAWALILGTSHAALAQAPPPSQPAAPAARSADVAAAGGHRVGLGLHASTLGLGAEVAVRVHRKANVRMGVNLLDYSREFDDGDSGITYTGALELRSAEAYLDWFPFGGGFHISPGLTVRNRNRLRLSAAVPAGERISVDDVDYWSASADPIRLAGAIVVASTRPALRIGWGNLVPRSRRFSVPFELGVIFQGSPVATQSFTGMACDARGLDCRDMATDATIQAHVRADEAALNDDLRLGVLRFYPVISFGFGVRF